MNTKWHVFGSNVLPYITVQQLDTMRKSHAYLNAFFVFIGVEFNTGYKYNCDSI